MPNTSFVQTDFRAGKWSPNAQGRMHDPKYKAALNVCNNGMPLYNGPWTRRPGFLWGGNTKGGQTAKLLSLYLKFATPYQLELTSGYLRFHIGNSWVFTGDTNVTVASISTATPAVVTLTNDVPNGWDDGDTIVFNLAAPSTSPILAGRQFQIQSISGKTFALYDALTGAAINGNTQPYTAPVVNGPDYVYKILEFATPFAGPVLPDVRLVQTDSVSVLFHPSVGTQGLTIPPYGSFDIGTQSFLDGPYFDINETTTTLTPSGVSGSITFTASSEVGVNNGLGFQNTDVGRMLRFQSAPPAWASGTTYANAAIVTGTDNNIYQSVVGDNVGNNPTTDNGTNWVVTGQTVIWIWAIITAVNSTTEVTATVQPAAVTGRSAAQIPGDILISTSASTSWQLGLYSATTGYPAGGTYYQGRLLMYGSAVTNRWDASCSDDPFNFAPSAPDGTVGDGNALSEEGNAPQINSMLWMLPTQQGIVVGTDNGEWLIYASSLGDPLTPTSVQFTRVSTYGCANIEPQQTELTTCFVQRERQRVLNYASYPYGEAAGWYADNLSQDADDICAPGVAEIRFQQEPSKFLWMRGNDGSLFGTTFQHGHDQNQNYNGWHNHNIGGGRTVTSISTGPSSDGLTTTLYTIAFNPTSGYYEYLMLDHLFDATQNSSDQNFTDGLAYPLLVTDTGSGLDVYGMFEIIGQTVTVNIGGLDLGDFVVQGPDGHINLPFTSTFTQAFYQGLSGPSYGSTAVVVLSDATATENQDSMGAFDPTDGNSSSVSLGALDQVNNRLVTLNSSVMRTFDLYTMEQLDFATGTQMFFNDLAEIGSPDTMCYHPGNNCCYFSAANKYSGINNSQPIARIDMDTMRCTGLFGTWSNSFLNGFPNGFGIVTANIIPLQYYQQNLVAFGYARSASTVGIGVMDGDELFYLGSANVSDSNIYLCPGKVNSGIFYGLGAPTYGSPSTTSLNLYKCQMFPNGVNGSLAGLEVTNVGSLSPSGVDATWAHFSNVEALAFDPTDGNVILYVQTADSVTTKAYWVKLNSSNASVIWACGDGTPVVEPVTGEFLCKMSMPAAEFSYARTNTYYTLNTSAGTLSSVSFASDTITFQNQLYWPPLQAIVLSLEVTYTGSPPPPYNSGGLDVLGDDNYMQGSNTYSGWGMISDVLYNPVFYTIPMSIGANYSSSGQLLRPDYGQDAGNQAGPAFGKKRRQHWFSAAVVNSQNFSISTDNTFAAANTDTVQVMDEEENVVDQPDLYTGTLSTTMPDGYSWDSQIAWQITRPLPLTITAIGGYIAGQDK